MTKTIILACVGGLTTSMLVERIHEVIYRDKLDYSFYSVGITGVDNLKNVDVLLLSPQLAYLKEKAKANPEPNVTMDYLQKQVKNLKAQVQRLEEINERYKQQFIVWQYNAYMHGMTQVTLNKPLIAVNRQRR